MSDTFGATDLDADMPGIGAAPGNARGAPSQLQQLVQRFTQQSQGKPNPKFLPPPPKSLGSTDGPADPVARSFVPVPVNAPHPPAGFTPFIHPVPRDSSQWSQPEQYPRLPQSFELPGMYQKLGSYFSQHGGFQSAPLGANSAAYAAAYQEAFAKGQDHKMRLAKEQLELSNEKLADLERARSIDYADKFAAYHERPGDPQDLHDEIWKVAVEHGDKDVQAMMERGASAEEVRRFLGDHEAHVRALEAANKKSAEQSDVDALYGLKKSGGGGGGDYDPYGPGASEGGAAPSPSAAAPASPAGQVAGPGAPSGDKRNPAVGDPLSPDKTKDETPDVFKDDPLNPGKPVNPEIASAATQMYKGEEPTGMDKNAVALARWNAERMHEETGKIMSDPNLKPGQYLDAVRKRLGPTVAADMEGIEDYSQPPGSVSGYGKQGDYLRGLENIVKKDRPSDPANNVRGWNADYYADRHRFRTEIPTYTILTRTKDMANQMENINNDLLVVQKDLEKHGVKATDIDLQGALQLLGAGSSMSRLMSDLNSYSTAYNVVVSGGHSTLGGTEDVNKFFKPYAPLATIRNVIKGHVPSAQGILQGIHSRWESMGGRPDDMPMGDLNVERKIDDIGKMDTVTGATPYAQTVNHNGVPAKWTGKNQFDRNAPENWVDPRSTRD
jgi:hypothetical protein